MHRGLVFGIIMAAVVLGIYQGGMPYDGVTANPMFVVCILLTVVGIELHNGTPLEDLVYETTYPELVRPFWGLSITNKTRTKYYFY